MLGVVDSISANTFVGFASTRIAHLIKLVKGGVIQRTVNIFAAIAWRRKMAMPHFVEGGATRISVYILNRNENKVNNII